MNRYDAIIIGAGHNGLVTAAYLAKAGKRVLVLERRPVIGGAASTEEIYPGFKYSTCASVSGLLHPRIVRELELRRHGLEMVPYDPVVFAPAAGGGSFLAWREPARTIEEIGRFSKADAANYPRFAALVRKLADLLGGLLLRSPPHLAGASRLDFVEIFKLGWKFRRLGKKEMREALRILPMSVADFLNEWFETEILKASLAAPGIIGLFAGPRAQGTAYLYLHHQSGESNGTFRAWSFVRGGMGSLPGAIAQVAAHHGAEVRTEAEVTRMVIKDGVVTGVVLKGGDELASSVVISNADAKTTFLRLLEPAHLEPRFVLRIQNVRFRGACAKVNLALGDLPRFKGMPDQGPAAHLHGLIQIGPSLEYLERAYDDAKYGDISKRPFLEITIPSVVDPSLAPRGKHVMSVLMQYAPYRLKNGDWGTKREELGDLVVDTINEYAPNFKDSILHRQVLTPLDLEEIYGLAEGNIYHGEMALDQLFLMRPVPGWARYRTPIKNLYLCGASAHPGGGITGAPGYNAAREILKDW
jgi:phytoene dehydrogenase-like protein